MDTTRSYSSDVAFTPTVKAVQTRKGSRRAYARMEERGSWRRGSRPISRQFIEAQTSVFLATANADGQPYIQHRGGPPGFLQRARRPDHRLCRFRRQPAVHHARAISPTIPRRICS